MDSSTSEFGQIPCYKYGLQSQINNRIVNSVDPDETARYGPSHLDLYCFTKVAVLVCIVL